MKHQLCERCQTPLDEYDCHSPLCSLCDEEKCAALANNTEQQSLREASQLSCIPMRRNQYTFEVARDIIILLEQLKPCDSLAIYVNRGIFLLDWTSSCGTPCGAEETAENIRHAYYSHPNR